MSFRPPAGGSFAGGTLTVATKFNDDVPLYLGTDSDAMLRYNVSGFSQAYLAMNFGTDTNGMFIVSNANKSYDFIGGAGGPSGTPVFIFTSEAQNRNTFGFLAVQNSAQRLFQMSGNGGDDINGTARNAAGMAVSINGGRGGTLGGSGGSVGLEAGAGQLGGGGSITLRTGSAGGAGNNNGGILFIDLGSKTGTGLNGYIMTSGSVLDFRFKNVAGGKFKILDEASEAWVGVKHDGTNGVYSTSTGLHRFDNQISTNQIVVGSSSINLSIAAEIIGLAGSGSGGIKALRVQGGAHQDNANTEVLDVDFDFSRTVNFVGGGGALALQRSFLLRAPTFTADVAQTITDAATLYIDDAPIASTNVTITGRSAAYLRTRGGGAVALTLDKDNATQNVPHLSLIDSPTRTNGTSIYAGSDGANTGTHITSYTNHSLFFAARSAVNSAQMALTPAGKLGVGTVAPDEVLHVVGNGKFSGTLQFGALSGLGAEILSGFISIKDAAGNDRKIAVIS